ncbi:hypothetical protein QC281_21765 [Streptomyces sp. DH17]|nr:hypothetical protein [Streptomyces sp. DH17]
MTDLGTDPGHGPGSDAEAVPDPRARTITSGNRADIESVAMTTATEKTKKTKTKTKEDLG